MKILITGGGTGGHFYPLVAVIDELNLIIEQQKIVNADIVFMSESPYDKDALYQRGVRFKKTYSGKLRRYFSIKNFGDVIKTVLGSIKSMWSIFIDFPDVIFSKGGYASFPVVLSAKLLRIPLIIHESDTVPGKVNKFSSSFAKRIAISFPETANYFPKNKKDKIALVGNPVRKEFFINNKIQAKDAGLDFFKLEKTIPIILIIGGSQGSQRINDNIIDVAGDLIKNYQVIHQCGKNNYEACKGRIGISLGNDPYRNRYHIMPFMSEVELKMAYGAADIVVSRAGGASIFELAASGSPSIMIPLPESAQDHQRENAYAYSRSGAADIIEEKNLTPHILLSEITRLIDNKEKRDAMSKAAFAFSKPDAAQKIAKEIINLVLEHA